MRLSYYKMINDMAVTLNEALSHVKSSGNSSMLSVCVQSLQAIIKALAPCSEDIKKPSVIENLNSMITMLSSENMDIDAAISLSEKLVSDCRSGLSYKIRVLFVAELGGKWDSMASVYDECMKRDDIDVDVVLEPVFREVKLPDGSVKHEEANYDWLTPLGIKHIPYKQYDIKKICPDITFFSQPYEGCTVPMFWPENMSKYTRVVYLPYFASETLCKASSSFTSFFELNVQKYAWRIACQSDIMKKYYTLYASRKGENVIACGIPKWDYPVKLTKENIPCPEKWKEKIKGKKVFLWNTHFSLLSEEKNPFSNEKEIISLFKNDPENISLIWRPHPMTETVIKMYFPKQHHIYRELIESVEKSANIVIDDSPTYDCAFVWSDALISVFSSLTSQYLLMKKPITIFENISYDALLEKYFDTDNVSDMFRYNFSLSINDLKEFIGDIKTGKVSEYVMNDEYYENYYKYADGNVGKRLMQKLLNDILKENGLFEIENSCIYNDSILIVGNADDSKECCEVLERKGLAYKQCTDITQRVFLDDNRLFSIKKIKPDSFENIIVTSKENSDMICQLLCSWYNIPLENIIPFWKMYSTSSYRGMICDLETENEKEVKYDGILMGSTHAASGIISNKLKGKWIDLSLPYQDIFYMKMSFIYCLDNYPKRFTDIRYAIIDVEDLFFFNYDVSVSEYILKYLKAGGFNKEPHHFNRNPYFNDTYKAIVGSLENEKYEGICSEVTEKWNMLFSNAFTNKTGNNSKIIDVVTDAQISNYKYTPNHALKISEKTIDENVKSLCEIIEKLRRLNGDVRVYITRIPRFSCIERIQLPILAKHTKYFNKIISELKNKYDIDYTDINRMSNISAERECYCDPERLNLVGADIVTDMLNSIIDNETAQQM